MGTNWSWFKRSRHNHVDRGRNFTMTMRNAFAGLSTEQKQDAMLNYLETATLLLASMLEKMPRVTANDQMATSIEVGSVGIAASQTLAAVTTVNQHGSKYVSGDNLNTAGIQHIYNNIIVS